MFGRARSAISRVSARDRCPLTVKTGEEKLLVVNPGTAMPMSVVGSGRGLVLQLVLRVSPLGGAAVAGDRRIGESIRRRGGVVTRQCRCVIGRVGVRGALRQRLAGLHEESEKEQNDDADGQDAEGHRLDPLEDDDDEVSGAARHRLRVVERGLDEVRTGNDDQHRQRHGLEDVREALVKRHDAQVDEEHEEAAEGEGDLLEEDVVDEGEDEHENEAPEVDDALPADAADDVVSVGAGDDVDDGRGDSSLLLPAADRLLLTLGVSLLTPGSSVVTRGSHPLSRGRRRPAVVVDEVDDHRHGEEEREDEGQEEDEQRDAPDLQETRPEQKHDEEGQHEDAHADDDAVLPRLQTRDVAVVEQHALAVDVGAVEQHQRVLRNLLVRVEEQRDERRQHPLGHRQRPDARASLRG